MKEFTHGAIVGFILLATVSIFYIEHQLDQLIGLQRQEHEK